MGPALLTSADEGADRCRGGPGHDSMMMPIFVRHGSGELTFTVRMDQSTTDLMQLYAQRTKATLDSQYFSMTGKDFEPHHMG